MAASPARARKATVDTAAFERAHWRKPSPSQYGLWMFTNQTTGDMVEITATYTDAVKQLTPGETFIVLS